MILDIENNLKKFIGVNDTINKSPESKKEHELDNNDRMHLINKKLDENIINDIYEDLIDEKKYITNENLTNVNDYVFNDIEFMYDHYLNQENGLFNKIDKCKTKIGSLLLKNICLKPIYDINILKKRQEIFKNIGKSKDKLLILLNKIRIIENDVMWFWNNSNMKHIDSMNDLIYFNYDIIPFFNVNDVLNNNEKALLVTNIYKIIVAPLLTILTPIISLLLPLIFLFYMQRKANLNIPI